MTSVHEDLSAEKWPSLSLRERDRRWSRVRDLMRQQGLDVLLAFRPSGAPPPEYDNYLTNEPPGGVVVFPREGEPVSLVWSPHFVIAHREVVAEGHVSWVKDVRHGASSAGVVAVLRERGYERSVIGVVGAGMTPPLHIEGFVPQLTWKRMTEALPEAQFKDISIALNELILVKSEEEIRLLRRACEIGEEACEAMLGATRPGVPESDIYAAVMYVHFKNGARGLAGVPLIFHSGPHTLLWTPPMWMVRGGPPRVIREGDIVLSELFPTYGGVHAQQQMCIAVGKVDPIKERLARVARSAYEEGLKVLRPGRRFIEVSDAMEVVLKDEKCWHLTPLIHSLTPLCWHDRVCARIDEVSGIEWFRGLREGPVFGADSVIQPGMSFELEPNACQGLHRINIGGTVLITEDGVEELNHLATEMRYV